MSGISDGYISDRDISGMESVLIGLGSNLGDRAGYLQQAAERLAAVGGVEWRRISSLHETAPVGESDSELLGGPYLNGAAEILTSLSPRDLLLRCLAIEADLGRIRTGRNAPRTVDLDLLLFGNLVIEEPGLVIPHPRMLERGFVLEPLAEIAPRRLHPVTRRTIQEHLEDWKSQHDTGRSS